MHVRINDTILMTAYLGKQQKQKKKKKKKKRVVSTEQQYFDWSH